MNYTFVYFIGGLSVFFIIMLTVVARLEKRLVWQYGELEAQCRYPDPTGYLERTAAGAQWAQFSLIGCTYNTKPKYLLNYGLFVSQERDSFAVICVGTIINLPYRSTTLFTRTMDGKVYCTTDNQNGAQIDLLGHWMSQLAPVPTFPQLVERHRSLLQERSATVQLFTEGREMDEFRMLCVERYRNMQQRGIIAYVDGSETSCQFTLFGAFRYAMLNYTLGMLRKITNGRVPRCL